ncbi:MAG TPA: SpoIIE family protein phosphatase [Mycobacterium sp.]|nr:SpoIIE family protein phosphatase [Mycobacterium sp.]
MTQLPGSWPGGHRSANVSPFVGPGEMAARMSAFDWAATPLGPVPRWPQSLRTAVGICLDSRYPMVIWWGPDQVLLYNDAWVPILGPDKHPALGWPGREVWPETWHIIGEQLRSVLATGQATFSRDQLLPAMRSGYLEEAYFTYSYSAIRDESGAVGGVFTAVTETTQRVLSDRRLRTLRTLGEKTTVAATGHSATVESVCDAALQTLADDRADIPLAAIYRLYPGDATAHLVGSMGVSDPSVPATAVYGSTAGLVLRDIVNTGASMVLDTVPQAWGDAMQAGASPVGDQPPRTALILPVQSGGEDLPATAMIAAVTPYRALDDDFRGFFDLITAQLSRALTDAQTLQIRAREYEQTRAVALTLQHAILGPTQLPHGFAVRYTPAVEPLEVGGDWYDVIELGEGRIGIVVGDSVGRGLPAAAVMGQLRSAAQALLLRTPMPAQALSDLDRFARRIPAASCTTVFCAVIDVAASTVRYSSAGHPPPVLVDRTGSHLLDHAQSVPLAATETVWSRPEAEVTLLPGATLLLYTDGLIERRGESLSVGIERASKALDSHRHSHPDHLADRLMTDLAPPSGFDDDVAVLLYRHPPASLTLRSPARPASLATIRAHLRRWLPAAAVSTDTAEEVLLAVGEAAANATEHATRGVAHDVELTVTAQLTKRGLALAVTDDGQWHQSSRATADRGHGIALMNALVDSVEITATGQGTTVEMLKELH